MSQFCSGSPLTVRAPSGDCRESPLITATLSEEKRRYERTKTFAEFLDPCGLRRLFWLASAMRSRKRATKFRTWAFSTLTTWAWPWASIIHGWTLTMDQLLDHSTISTFPAVKGTVRISIGDLNLPLGTLGGKNSSINWNGINDRGEAVGMSETSILDPDGEDLCGFGTHATCLPFLWQNGVMHALPTVGGNNGQPAPSITADKSQDMRKMVWWTPPARLASLIIGLTCR